VQFLQHFNCITLFLMSLIFGLICRYNIQQLVADAELGVKVDTFFSE